MSDGSKTLDRQSMVALAFRVHLDHIEVHRTFVYLVPKEPASVVRRAHAVTERLPSVG